MQNDRTETESGRLSLVRSHPCQKTQLDHEHRQAHPRRDGAVKACRGVVARHRLDRRHPLVDARGQGRQHLVRASHHFDWRQHLASAPLRPERQPLTNAFCPCERKQHLAGERLRGRRYLEKA